jgi:hypothetical protein
MPVDYDLHNHCVAILRFTAQQYPRSYPLRPHHRAGFMELECAPLTQRMCIGCSEKVFFIVRVHLQHDRLLEHASILRQR